MTSSSAMDVRRVNIRSGAALLPGALAIPTDARGLILFAHGSGSSRFSPRNRFVAGVLQTAGLATLLFDLLTMEEQRIDEQTLHLRFDIGLLAERLTRGVDWASHEPAVSRLPLGLFGASTGAAAALAAAADRPDDVTAVVSRGGRPDLAEEFLADVSAPTLLIVGQNDPVVEELNRRAAELLRGERRLEVVPGATHLFEEPGALEQVAVLARDWFLKYLAEIPFRPSPPR